MSKDKREARRRAKKRRSSVERGMATVNRRNMVALGMILGGAGKGGSHGDEKKKRSRKACRGRVEDD
jgi:hypothetical protein